MAFMFKLKGENAPDMDIWNYAQPYHGKKLAFAFGTHDINKHRRPVLLRSHQTALIENVPTTKISNPTMHQVVDIKHVGEIAME